MTSTHTSTAGEAPARREHPVYMDYHATTPVDPRVMEAMLPFFTGRFGNAASKQHRYGWEAADAVSRAREAVARVIGGDAREIIFTSGATESNNLAIKGTVEARRGEARHAINAITVRTEHRSVLDVFRRLERSGLTVTWLDVDEHGIVDPAAIAAAITPATVIVSVMLANNEIGTIANLAEIGEICRSKSVTLHTDATQAVGKIPVDVRGLNVDLLSMSAHKFYGPKGIGCLYVKSQKPARLPAAQIDGGGHEQGLRSGTLNVPGIVGMGAAAGLALTERESEAARVGRLRDLLNSLITAELPRVFLNGPPGHPERRLPNNLNLSFEGVEDNALMLSMKEIALSTGSACSSSTPEPSHVLKALGIPRSRIRSAIRFGLGKFTTEEEVRYVASRVVETVRRIRGITTNNPIGPVGTVGPTGVRHEFSQQTR